MTRRRSTSAESPPAGDPPARAYETPVPNPPPLPSDLAAPRLVSARGALLRSLVVWGWGQIASRDRRGWLLVPLQPIGVLGLLALGPPLLSGTAVTLVFLAGVGVLVAWLAVAVHAYRRAARRRALVELPAHDGGAIVLLVVAPIAIAASTLLWGVGGRSADPATVVDHYVADWRLGRASDASARFTERPGTNAIVREIWEAQLTALHNELIRLVPRAGPAGGIDPDAPFETIRWVDAGATPSGGRRVAIEVARRETEHGLLLGLLPVSTQRLIPLEQLGTVELVRVGLDLDAPFGLTLPAGPWADAWRIQTVTVMDVTLGD